MCIVITLILMVICCMYIGILWKILQNKSNQFGDILYNSFKKLPSVPIIHLCITTIPERFHSTWFERNLRKLLNTLKGPFKIHYSIPLKSSKGEEYQISNSLQQLAKEDSRIIFYRCKHDYGPITKIRGALDNPDIPEDTPLLICDDDILYKEYFVIFMLNSFIKYPNKIHIYCREPIEGFRGYMATKKKFRKVELNNPPSCFRIDDDVVQLTFPNKDDHVIVPYGYFNIGWCSLDKSNHDFNTPKWTNALKYDNRKPMSKQCKKDFDSKNFLHI
jgi:hypothetical protein